MAFANAAPAGPYFSPIRRSIFATSLPSPTTAWPTLKEGAGARTSDAELPHPETLIARLDAPRRSIKIEPADIVGRCDLGMGPPLIADATPTVSMLVVAVKRTRAAEPAPKGGTARRLG